MRRPTAALPLGLLLAACAATPSAAPASSSATPSPSTAASASAAASTTAAAVGTSASDPEAACAAPAAPDPSTPAGFLGWMAAHPDQVSLVLGTDAHLPDTDRPLASARKVVHLAAWAAAVRDGVLVADRTVPVADWERWYLPGTDGGAHVAALTRLGIAHDGVRATDPTAAVPLSDVVSAMIRESDNAAPDLLRDLLGPEALAATAAELGWAGAPTASFLGDFLTLLEPTVGDPEAAARRYVDDPAEAARVQSLPLPAPAVQAEWAAGSTSGSAAGLAAMHAAISAGGLPEARAQLEWQPAPAGHAGLGFKGGSLPGVLAEAVALRPETGADTVGVLLVQGLSPDEWSAALAAGLTHQQVMLAAMTDPAAARQLDCALA
ncbi:serine hydrolase [Nakamurella flavida]|uniref:Serine hydrolase n=1 Tax=Nakamurella flavida TaxID=363630 RepID=A0A939C206_9ACTN|nr:serine hydrolase [Nakamurella flavida]MBM9476025.1 serine hydrolase [Nakamurella flavida]MDP9777232.1 beta-lactamase class A [Nakamurella flavida]